MEMNVTVRQVTWITQPYGYVKPYLHFTPVTERQFDTVMGIHAQNIIQNKIGVGAVIKIQVPEEDEPPIAKFIEVNEPCPSKVEHPVFCIADCPKPLVWKEDDLYCPCLWCPVQERSVITKFLYRVLPTIEYDEWLSTFNHWALSTWLDHFPMQGGLASVHIKDIRDFIQQFKQAGPKCSRNRYLVLLNKFSSMLGNDVEYLHKIECLVESKLTEGISYEDFWFTLNLPTIGKDEAKLLKEVNPLGSTLQRIAMMGIDEKRLEILAVYQERWITLAQFWSTRYKLVREL